MGSKYGHYIHLHRRKVAHPSETRLLDSRAQTKEKKIRRVCCQAKAVSFLQAHVRTAQGFYFCSVVLVTLKTLALQWSDGPWSYFIIRFKNLSVFWRRNNLKSLCVCVYTLYIHRLYLIVFETLRSRSEFVIRVPL